MANRPSLLVPLVLLVGCAWRRVPEVDARVTSLAAADARFAARASEADVDAAVAGWSALLARDPTDGEVLARLAHAEWVRAQLAVPAEVQTHLEVGEEYGWRCLTAAPALDASRRAHGGRVTDEVVASVGAERAPCLVWTAVHAVERAASRGDGADLALAEARVLLARARALATDASPWSAAPGVAEWADARVAWLGARGPVEAAAARQALGAVARRHPAIARWSCDARRAGEELPAPEEDRSPEGRAVLERWDSCRPGGDESGHDEP